MSDTLSRVLALLQIDPTGIDIMARRMPIEIPNVCRDDLARLFCDLGFTAGVEIGTERGRYAETLCAANGGLRLSCVDPWTAYDNNEGYRAGTTQAQFDLNFETAKARLQPYGAALLRKTSMNALADFANESLDFVYIDGNHRLEDVVNDIAKWTRKVSPGGIVSGHDWFDFRLQNYSHVVEAVLAYTRAYRVTPWFVLGLSQNRSVRPLVGDRQRSWMFVKA